MDAQDAWRYAIAALCAVSRRTRESSLAARNASPLRSSEMGPSLPATYRLDETLPVAHLYRGGWPQPGEDARLPTCVTGHKVHGARRLPTAGPALGQPSPINFSLGGGHLAHWVDRSAAAQLVLGPRLSFKNTG
jgi:hypothetical protein